MGELAERGDTGLALSAPQRMLELAIEKGTSLEQLQQLMDLQQRHEANEARKAFVSAMNAFKANPPTVTKSKEVAFSGTQYKHATLADVVDAAISGMSKHGLSHRWVVDQKESGLVFVECVITHAQGHAESTKMCAPPDDSGKKNKIQQIASTVTYLERYTLMAALGLAAKDMDDDAVASGVRQGKLDTAIEELADSIDCIKTNIAEGNLSAAAEAWFELSDDEKISIWVAPSKGGPFTTEERSIIKTKDFRESYYGVGD